MYFAVDGGDYGIGDSHRVVRTPSHTLFAVYHLVRAAELMRVCH